MSEVKVHHYQYDVVIVGAGGAGGNAYQVNYVDSARGGAGGIGLASSITGSNSYYGGGGGGSVHGTSQSSYGNMLKQHFGI